MKKSVAIVIIFLSIASYLAFINIQKNACFITLAGQRFNLDLAQTDAKRVQGLSGTSFFPANTGMLFVFDQPDTYGFWMKDMNYALDIIWLNNDLKIVDLEMGVTPETYPKVFYPNALASYVLEINAGNAQKLDLDFDDQAQLMCGSVLK